MHLFIYQFHAYDVLSISNVLGIIFMLGIQNPYPPGAYILVGQIELKPGKLKYVDG